MTAAQKDRSVPPWDREAAAELGDFLDELTVTWGISWFVHPATASEALTTACPDLTQDRLRAMWEDDLVTAGGHDLALAWLRCRTRP